MSRSEGRTGRGWGGERGGSWKGSGVGGIERAPGEAEGRQSQVLAVKTGW